GKSMLLKINFIGDFMKRELRKNSVVSSLQNKHSTEHQWYLKGSRIISPLASLVFNVKGRVIKRCF
ncbi:hypothetical protein, partial [Echinicola sediminis]